MPSAYMTWMVFVFVQNSLFQIGIARIGLILYDDGNFDEGEHDQIKQVSMKEQDVLLKREEGTQVTEGASPVFPCLSYIPSLSSFLLQQFFFCTFSFLFSPSCFEIARPEAMCKSGGHIFRLCS